MRPRSPYLAAASGCSVGLPLDLLVYENDSLAVTRFATIDDAGFVRITDRLARFSKIFPNVKINYQPIGSGGGVAQVQKGTVFFGASDYPLTPDQMMASACWKRPSGQRTPSRS